MLVLPPSKRNGLNFSQIWYPTDPDVIRKVMDEVTVVSVHSSPFDAKAGGLLPFQVKEEEWWTSLVSLKLSEEELLKRMDPKSCRYEIRKTEKLSCSVYVNEKLDEAYELIQAFIRRKGYKKAMTDAEWEEILNFRPVHSIFFEGKIVATHVIFLDEPHRARLLISATLDREDETVGKWVGPLNRRLHWEEFLHYKARGFAEYDFGGVYPDPKHPFYGIGHFKTAFGGDNVKWHNFVVIKNPVIRAAWIGARKLKPVVGQFKSFIRGQKTG